MRPRVGMNRRQDQIGQAPKPSWALAMPTLLYRVKWEVRPRIT
jgi:hypothetical protein